MSSIKGEISRAQGRILDMLVDCENRFAGLYERFAVALPQAADFWSRIASDERRHAEVLEGLHFLLASGFLFQNIGRFSTDKMKPILSIIEDADLQMASATFDFPGALRIALNLECSLLESCFYVEVTSDAPAFAARCKVLQSETEVHIGQLRARIARETGAVPSGPEAGAKRE